MKNQFEDGKYESDIDVLKILCLKSKFGQIGPKFKPLSYILENLDSRHFKGLAYKSDIDKLGFFILKP